MNQISIDDQIQQSHEIFRQVVEGNPFGVYIVDHEFKIRYISDGARETFSSQMPVVGRGFPDVMRAIWPEPFATEAIERFRHTLETGEPYTAPLLIEERADRKTIESYDWKIKRISLPDNKYGVVCYYYDVTERQKWEQSLRDSNELVHTIAENSTEALIMMDASGYLIYCNQTWLDMTGFSREELESAPLHELVHHHYPDGRPFPITECPIDRALPQDSLIRFHEDVFFRKDGTPFDVLCSARPIYRDGKPHSTIIEVSDVTEQNAAKRELIESQQFLQAALSATGLAVWSWDLKTGQVHSPQDIRSLFGMNAEAPMVAREFVKRVDPQDRDRVDEAMKTAIQTGDVYNEEFRVVRPDGATHWLHMLGRIVRDESANLDSFLGVVADVTERKNVEMRIRESEKYFRTMADASPAMLWITDRDHMCTYLSRSWYEFTGQTEEEGLGLGWTDATHPDDRQRAGKEFLSAAEAHVNFVTEYRLRTASGEYRHAVDLGRPRFNKAGEFEGYIGSVIDDHERRLAENTMRASESRLRLAAEATGFGTHDYDAIRNRLVWSPELYAIYGISPEITPTLQMVRQLIFPDDLKAFETIMADAFRTDGSERYEKEYRIVRSDGAIRWVVDTGRVIREEKGDARHLQRIVGTVQDITDRKNFERSLQQAMTSAEAANRSRGEFLANMSHEIRTPMAAILGHADILKDHLVDPDNLQVVDTIRRNGHFLLNIVNDILDLSKIDAGKMEIDTQPVRPDAIVGEIRSLMDVRAAEKDIPLRIAFTGPVPETIDTDAVRLRQVLLNLVGNAIKFTDEGEVRLNVDFDASANRLQFDVVDTGIGIPSEKLDSLFEPFVQVDNTSTRSFGGTGLGLAICRRLAQALGGLITVESELGKGSRFTLSLDVMKPGQLIEPNISVVEASDLSHDEITLTANVLVVDDRRDIRYLAQHFIEKAGGKVFTATNGKEAVNFVMAEQSPRIDVIVMDMQMPVMDGYEASRQLRSRGCVLPILALTANAMKSDRDECLAAGCSDYTTKPLDQRKLVEMIARLAE
ncbi:PAS domain S-box protein [Aporhodopirellula aestuarii]|uniref:histidine kinase n=1 Tax=Aporhodopirellula aestuarii TaxID=2950107 RepID=A0ABT0UBK6_9BACT|nr:PAS domain S-box protein [Aporhodopirellula aestuarii]MCM2374298.1 PAS domain S-box protein [Aporhodopirellula aestuarii]